MPIKLKIYIQTLQKSQDRPKISFAFEFNNKTSKKSLWQIFPPPIQLSWICPQIQSGLSICNQEKT